MKITRFNDLLEDGRVVQRKWEMDRRHRLQYRTKDKDERFNIDATIVDVEPTSLVLSLTEEETDQKIVRSMHRLTGRWSLDKKNRITFEVETKHVTNDVLTFAGEWKVGKNHEIIYTYREAQLKTKKGIERALVFQGYWDITGRNRLTYFLRKESDSAFRFRGAFQTHSILAKRREIRYQAGAEVEGRRAVKTIVLFGKWKVSRDFAIAFEIEYKDGRRHAMTFGGEYAFDGNHRIEVKLTDRKGEPLGIEVIFTKAVLKDGELFARLVRSQEESRVEGGMKVAW